MLNYRLPEDEDDNNGDGHELEHPAEGDKE